MNTQLKQILDILVNIDLHIADKTITIEELKSLILIIYHELLTNEKTINPITKDYLVLVTKHFIDLENSMQQAQIKNKKDDIKSTENFLTHKKISSLNKE